MAAEKKEVEFRIQIAMENKATILVDSADVAMQYYPPKSSKRNIGLIVNLAKKFGKAIIDKSNEDCTVMYLILSENSPIEKLNIVCTTAFDAISDTLFKQEKNVIIHCSEGRTRSPTLAYLYMTLVLGWTDILSKSHLQPSKYMACISSLKAKQDILPALKEKYGLKQEQQNDNDQNNDKESK